MRILFTTTATIDQRLDGLTIFTDSIARSLNACKSAIFASDLRNFPDEPKITHTPGHIETFVFAGPAPKTPAEAVDRPGCAEVFAKVINQFNPDVIHIHSLENLSAGIIEAAKRAKVPVIFTVHDLYLICPGMRMLFFDGTPCFGPDHGRRCGNCLAATGHLTGKYKGRMRWLDRRLDVKVHQIYKYAFAERFDRLKKAMAKVDAIITPSKMFGELLADCGMIKSYDVIPNGSELTHLPPRIWEPPPVFGMLAHHSLSKGTHLLVHAVQSMPDLSVNVKIYGTGDIRYMNHVRAIAHGDRRFSFQGPFTQDYVPGILESLDVLVLPSLVRENCPLVVQDALAAGRPCIVAKDCGAAETVEDGRHGLYFERGNARSLAEAIRAFSVHHSLIEQMRNNVEADQPVARRAWTAARYLDNYARVVMRNVDEDVKIQGDDHDQIKI